MKNNFDIKLSPLAFAFWVTCSFSGLATASVNVTSNPTVQSNAIVFQVQGVVWNNWYSATNSSGFTNPPLNRADITNVLTTYFAAQHPDRFALYSSLFLPGTAPTNSGEFGAIPEAVWLKARYEYGPFTLLDVRFRYSENAQSMVYETLISLSQTNGSYYLTPRLEDPAVCLFRQEADHRDVWIGNAILATNWTGAGYFASTNFLWGTNTSNPWVVWIPGSRFTELTVLTNSPTVTNLLSVENVAISALQALLQNNTNAYMQLLHPDEIDETLSYYSATPRQVVTNGWSEARTRIIHGVRLTEEAVLGEIAYIIFQPLNQNGSLGNKDWLFLRRYGNAWRISQQQNELGSTVLSFLLNTCSQFAPTAPIVLPGEND